MLLRVEVDVGYGILEGITAITQPCLSRHSCPTRFLPDPGVGD